MQVEFLRQQAKDNRNDLEFIDYSVKEPFDEKWKTHCRERIARSDVLVVMIGEDTHSRPAVNWEIKTAYELGIPVVGVRIYKDANHKIPEEMIRRGAPIIPWQLKQIQEEIDQVE